MGGSVVFRTNLEQKLKSTVTYLATQPTKTQQRLVFATKNTRLLPDGYCCLIFVTSLFPSMRPSFRVVDSIWKVMAHAQKPDFVFPAKRTSPFKSAGGGVSFSRLPAAEVCVSAVVMLDTPCSEVVWRVLATHCIRQFPLHFPSCASPCAITFQTQSNASKPVPLSLCPPQISHGMTWDGTWAYVVRSQWLTAWAMAQWYLIHSHHIYDPSNLFFKCSC